MGDIFGVLVSDNPRTGIGFQSNCAVGIRNADNTCQYDPVNC
jgi:hypothetical protein